MIGARLSLLMSRCWITWIRSVAAAVTVGSTRSVGICGELNKDFALGAIYRSLNSDNQKAAYENKNKRNCKMKYSLIENSDKIAKV